MRCSISSGAGWDMAVLWRDEASIPHLAIHEANLVAWGLGLPGFQGMHLDPDAGAGQNYDAVRSPEAEEYYLHFPDGNATVARLLVRRLIPDAVAGATLDDVVTAAA